MSFWLRGTQFEAGLGLPLPGAPAGTPVHREAGTRQGAQQWPSLPASTVSEHGGTNLHVSLRSLSSAAGYVATPGQPNKCDSLAGAAAVILATAARPPVGDGLACVTLIEHVCGERRRTPTFAAMCERVEHLFLPVLPPNSGCSRAFTAPPHVDVRFNCARGVDAPSTHPAVWVLLCRCLSGCGELSSRLGLGCHCREPRRVPPSTERLALARVLSSGHHCQPRQSLSTEEPTSTFHCVV